MTNCLLYAPYWKVSCNPGMCSAWELNQQTSLHWMMPNQLSQTSPGYYFFLIQSWSICIFVGICPFLLDFYFLDIKLFIVVSYNLFYFCLSCNVSPFISDFNYLSQFFFLLVSLIKDLSILVNFSKHS